MSQTRKRTPGIWRRLGTHMAPALRAERRPITLAVVALLGEVALRVLEPWPLKVVFDHVLSPNARPLAWLPALSPATLAALAAVALLLLVGLRAWSGYVQTISLALAANRVLTHLRAALYRRLQVLPLSFHSTARAGDLTVRLTGDVGMLQDVTLTALLPLIGDACVLVGMLGLMAWIEPTLTLWALLPVPLFLMRWRRTQAGIREAARAQRKREGAMAASVAESFAAIKTVQALSLEQVLGESFTRASRRSADQGVKAKRLSARLERSVDLLIALSTGILLWQGARRVLAGSMTPGELLVFVAYLKTAFKPFQSFAKYTSRLGKAGAAAERVLDVLDRSAEVADRPGAVEAPRFKGEVRFEHTAFSYVDGTPVLRDASFDVPAGELVAIVGRSGAGKSTIGNLLMRLYDPASGRVCIDGLDIRDVTLASLRAQIGVVLQDTVLFAGTIRENLTLGASGLREEDLREALRHASALDFVEGLPAGLDTPVGERGVTLSNGQRQRLAIARAVLRRTPLLVLDEPTVGLDEENEAAVSDAIVRLSRGRTTFLITHALALAARANRVLVVEDGRVCEQGTPSDLLRRGGAFAVWYREQAARMTSAPLPVPVPHAAS